MVPSVQPPNTPLSSACQRVGHRPGRPGCQLGEVLGVRLPGRGAECGGKDRERDLPRQTIVCKRVPLAIALVDRQIVLSVLELGDESVVNGVHFVQVDTEPSVHTHVAGVANLQRSAAGEFPLDAEIPLLHIRLADIGIHRKKRVASKRQARSWKRRCPGLREKRVRRERLAEEECSRLEGPDSPACVRGQIAKLEEEGPRIRLPARSSSRA